MSDIFTPIHTWVLPWDHYAHAPCLCADAQGRLWVAWIGWVEGSGEAPFAQVLEPGGAWSAPFAVGPVRPAVRRVVMAPWRDGVLCAWIDEGDDEGDGLKLRVLRGPEALDDIRVVLPSRRRPTYAALCSEKDRFFLAWSARVPGGTEIEGFVGDDPLAPTVPMRLSHRRRHNLYPAVELSQGHAFVAWQYMTFRGGSRLFLRRIAGCETLESPTELLGNDGGTYAMCAMHRCHDGVWLAWHTDMDPLRGPRLVRWVDVGHVSLDGAFHRAKMPDADRDAKGEDQGFEFPALVVDDEGGLVVFGRGSQSLRRQDLTSSGWTRCGVVAGGQWECRGRYAAVRYGDHAAVAGRERAGITVRLLPLASKLRPRTSLTVVRDPRFSQSSKGVHILGRRVLFGDIHQHTALSDGTGTLEEAYNRARYRYGDDVVAVSDHESFLGRRTPPGQWAEYAAITDDFYEPGEFVTLHAYEWTGRMHPGPGHKVVYPPSGEWRHFFSRDDGRTATSEGLMQACKQAGALVVPHHVGWTGADIAHHDEEVSACYEIVSCHGAYERPGVGPIGTRGDDKPGQFVGELLDRGMRFGLVGGSDGHGLNWHHGISRIEDSHRTGLTAVFAEEVTREGVLDALFARRCYATSGARIGLWFEIDGHPMGRVVQPGGMAGFRVVVVGTAPLSQVCLVTERGREMPLKTGDGNKIDVCGTLPPPPSGKSTYYYVRVVQTDGHCAWSSPIWIEAAFDPIGDRLIG